MSLLTLSHCLAAFALRSSSFLYLANFTSALLLKVRYVFHAQIPIILTTATIYSIFDQNAECSCIKIQIRISTIPSTMSLRHSDLSTTLSTNDTLRLYSDFHQRNFDAAPRVPGRTDTHPGFPIGYLGFRATSRRYRPRPMLLLLYIGVPSTYEKYIGL
jgi:hypothetical protein